MAHGFRVKNQATGSISIDQDYSNLALIGKYALTSASTAVPGYSATASIATVSVVSAMFPVVAVASPSAWALYSVSRSGSTWTFKIIVVGLSQPVTTYVFGNPPVLGSGWGLRIRSGGVVRFDSRHRYLRRVARVAGGEVLTTQSGSLPAGTTYAAVMASCGLASEKIVQNNATFYRYSEFIRIGSFYMPDGNWSAQPLTLRGIITETPFNPGPSYTHTIARGPCMIVDVTGY